jgi:murein DD-endopeptidase MepM/ murein hydrolase activator NlpD
MDPADIATAPLDAVNAVGGVIAVGGVNAVGGVEAIKESILSATVPSGTVGPEHPASSRGRRASTTGTVQRRSPAASPATRSASTARPVSLRRRVAQKSFPPVVMVAAAALLIGTSVPPSALFDPDAPPASAAYASIPTTDAESDDGAELVAAAELEEDQVLEMPVAENVAAPVATRDEWSVTSYADMLRLKYGTRNFSYSTTGEGAVRWPFPYAVPISSGFGDRVAPCWGCSSYHRGLDMTPGRGTPVYSVAEGVVTGVGPSSTYGYRVEIEHVINGQRVKSLYAHMEWDSSALVVGDEIPVGEFLGTVGNSGLSTGPHLHLEIHIDDIPIDPFAWLMTNAA